MTLGLGSRTPRRRTKVRIEREIGSYLLRCIMNWESCMGCNEAWALLWELPGKSSAASTVFYFLSHLHLHKIVVRRCLTTSEFYRFVVVQMGKNENADAAPPPEGPGKGGRSGRAKEREMNAEKQKESGIFYKGLFIRDFYKGFFPRV
jgi:hypothetical protein